MRRRQRYTVHGRLLLTFLLLGCAGSFVLGQEMARAYTALPVYAAQSLTFSGAGITASLVTPIQATGSIGRPTTPPKVVKHSNKPTNKPKSKGPTTKPVTAPVTSPPIVLQGTPVAVPPPTTSPCASASCLPGAKPELPVIPPSSAAPTGTAGSDTSRGASSDPSSDSSGTQITQCAPLGLVTHLTTTLAGPATPSLGADPTRCPGDTTTDGASSAETPTTLTPGVIEAPAAIGAPQGALPAPVVHSVVPVIAPIVAAPITLAPALAPTETSAAVGDLAPTDAGDQATPVLIT